MKFSGRLQIEADPRNWLKTEFDLSQGRVELVSGDEVLGSWSTGQVKAERLEGDRFQLQLGPDRAVFAADDALAFSYEALPALAKKSVLAAATGFREKLRKGIAGTERAPEADPEVHAADHHQPAREPVEVQPLASSIAAPPTRRLRELIQEAVKNNAADAAAKGQSFHWEAPPAQVPEVEDVPGYGAEEIETEYIPEDPPAPQVVPAPVEQARQEPAPVEYARPEPVLPEPVRPEPRPVEYARREPVLPEAARPEPAPVEYARPEPVLPEPIRPEMIDRVGALRPLFEVDRTALAPVVSPVALRPVPIPHQPSVSIGPPEEVVKEFPPLYPVAELAPSPGLRLTLDALIEEVRKGEMSPMQIIAVTDLVRAVAEAIEDRNRA